MVSPAACFFILLSLSQSTRAPLQVQVVCQTPVQPMQSAALAHLVYELQITNLGNKPVSLTKAVALGPKGAVLGALQGSDLTKAIVQAGSGGVDPQRIDPGRMSVLFVWLDLAPKELPAKLTHRLLFVRDGVQMAIEGVPVPVDLTKPIVLGPPLRGDRWLAGNGPSNDANHRRTRLCLDGQATIGQRFAIAYVQIGPDGESFAGDRFKNESYHCYGYDVLAVKDAKVVGVTDGLPLNTPGSFAVEITRETIAGNHVILDLGSGLFAAYAHLIPGSILVKVGDLVRAGQVLAKLGNTGNSSEPHLHFQVMNRPDFLASEGLPYAHHEIKVQSTSLANGKIVVQPKGKAIKVRKGMPLLDQLVAFPAVRRRS